MLLAIVCAGIVFVACVVLAAVRTSPRQRIVRNSLRLMAEADDAGVGESVKLADMAFSECWWHGDGGTKKPAGLIITSGSKAAAVLCFPNASLVIRRVGDTVELYQVTTATAVLVHAAKLAIAAAKEQVN